MTWNLCNAVVSTSPVSQPTPCSPTQLPISDRY